MKVRDLKKGQVVWECERGMNCRMVIAADAERVKEGKRDGHIAYGIADDGQRITLFQTIDEMAHHYGPRLYDSPQYTERLPK